MGGVAADRLERLHERGGGGHRSSMPRMVTEPSRRTVAC
jgi:hypothetical protein